MQIQTKSSLAHTIHSPPGLIILQSLDDNSEKKYHKTLNAIGLVRNTTLDNITHRFKHHIESHALCSYYITGTKTTLIW